MICEECKYIDKRFICDIFKKKINSNTDCFYFEKGERDEDSIANCVSDINKSIWSSDRIFSTKKDGN